MKNRTIELLLTGITVVFAICYFLAIIIIANTTTGWLPIVPVMAGGIIVVFALCALVEHFETEDEQ